MALLPTASKTAILIFANSAREDAKQKAIPHSDPLFNELTNYTLREVQKTLTPYFHFTEKEQQGHSFGDRFIHAIQTVFSLGYERIITIGNDTPQLKAAHITETIKALDTGKTVLGPSLDGGFYLMGLHKTDFDPELFKRLPWQRFSLFHKISDILKNTDRSIHSLPVLEDMDTLKDIKRLSTYIKSISTSILKAISLLVRTNTPIVGFHFLAYITLSLKRPFNKGSPMFRYS